jgi:hypothetical protein
MTSLLDYLPDDYGDRTEGERRRDHALNLHRVHRPELLRRLQRAFLTHLLTSGPATSDPVRALVPIPTGTDPRVVGSAVRGLAEAGIIVSVGRRKSHRPQAHARQLEEWGIADDAKARRWLSDHPDLDPPADPAVPALV